MMIEPCLLRDVITVTVHQTDWILLGVPHTGRLHLGLHLASLLGLDQGGAQHHQHHQHQPAGHLYSSGSQLPLSSSSQHSEHSLAGGD